MLTRNDLEKLAASIAGLGGRRLAIFGLVLAASAVTVLGGSYLVSRQEPETAYVGLSAQDATRISRVLGDSGLFYEISADGSRLTTRRGEASRVRAYLAERGLPSGAGSGYELFDKVGPLGLTTFMQEVTRVRALEGEISRTIQLLRGVRAARVHIVIGDQMSFRRQSQPPSASVVIRTETVGDRSQAAAIRQIVAAAVPSLPAADVRVISADGQVLSGGADDKSASADRFVAIEKALAEDVQGNVSRTLVPQLGLENFEVSVALRINMDKRQVNETTYDPATKVERSVRVVKETGNSANGSGRANVSVEQNIPGEQGAPSGSDQSRRSNQKRDELINYEVGSRSTAVTSDGYRIERLTVAVVINNKRLAELSGQRASSEAVSKAITDIERLVSSAAGADQKRGDIVTVTAADFVQQSTSADLPPATGTITGWVVRQSSALLNISGLLAATAIVVFFGLRPATNALLGKQGSSAESSKADQAIPALVARNAPRAAELLVDQGSDATAAGLTEEPPEQVIRRLASEDPARAALVLRRWLKEESAG
jgi:flagellar M-ring protein FliF